MNFKRLTLCASLALAAAFPATAMAQYGAAPGEGDHYLGSIQLATPDSPLEYGRPIGLTADTSGYTVQSDMFSPPGAGGPQEPTQCGQSNYGNTIWSDVYSNRWGRLSIDTAGPFDAVIGVIPYRSPQEPAPLDFGCVDALGGFQEQVRNFIVFPGSYWSIQVGGTGTPLGGPVQVKYELLPPARAGGDAIATWDGASGGIRLKGLVVKAPRGSRVSIKCARRRCGKTPRAFTSKKVGLAGAIGRAQAPHVAARKTRASASAGKPALPASAVRVETAKTRADVRAAKNYTLLRGRFIRIGTRLEVRIKRFGHIGTYFAYNVGSRRVQKIKRCMNPGSNKARKRCSG